jgi:hypothetical protein
MGVLAEKEQANGTGWVRRTERSDDRKTVGACRLEASVASD